MDLNINTLRTSVRRLLKELPDSRSLTAETKKLHKFLELKTYTNNDVNTLIDCLGDILLCEDYTEIVALLFDFCLLPILVHKIPCDDECDDSMQYLRKCAALSKLISISLEAKKYARKYFRNLLSPFECVVVKEKRSKTEDDARRSVMVRFCYRLLVADGPYYKSIWDWSVFVDDYLHYVNSTELDRLYINHIFAILSNMSNSQLESMNAKFNEQTVLSFHREQERKFLSPRDDEDVEFSDAEVKYLSKSLTNIGGVYLPIFNGANVQKLQNTSGVHQSIVKVDSTMVNLRSIAMGIASGKAVCLSGPVGCGKTTLVDYLARVTGRVAPMAKSQDNKENTEPPPTVEKPSTGTKRKSRCEAGRAGFVADDTNGFLRIQLGDQTDSKMLLGQYRCTDVPGEFIWSPGVLTQAVMNGSWLLLEDLDSATQDTYTILSSLLENSYLSVPGYRDRIDIEPGFQLFMTVRSTKGSVGMSRKSLFSLLEKYLYIVNILPLSRNELCKVVSHNYPKLATVANRIVDVFLRFSSGDHEMADHLRQQETDDKADTSEQLATLPFDDTCMAAVPNAGRLVSTRDLIKLCERSNPVFSVTSTACAYFVLQNAVDVFCSHLPHGPEKTQCITSIGAKLGIIQSRCEFLANEDKPDVTVEPGLIKVGRACLEAKSAGASKPEPPHKRLKLNEAPAQGTFSFTRMATCLLERIAVCVSQGEPVLLVGETGVGKTSSVQYLAERTDHKLVVVNMNNQSDVSDLIGGFKPVDVSYVLRSMRSRFEALFNKTYQVSKNEDFLTKLSVCFAKKKYNVAVQTMLTVTNNVLKRCGETRFRPEVGATIPQWREIKIHLSKMKSQLAKSLNISFAFIPGSLVNCITNGDWVLLDEINLASSETLECLSTILEPDGSVVLLERGDCTPVTRHPEFRIFACMNPNTDIGKKDLPVGIRNRFTEFFVDELTTDADLSLLVSDYLASTGIQRKSVTAIVKLFKRLKKLSQLELNDGLGNRPVFSLRTLCRSLRICAKNLCGSVERNLYESFCMSFLTQLDPASHHMVLQLIKEALLSNERAVLRQGIPKPGDNYLNFEGYWIQQGPLPIQECSNYILTLSVGVNLRDLARIIAIGKLPVLLQGPTSAGKTSLIEFVAKRSGNRCLRINNHEHTDLQEYIGTYAADLSGKLSFVEGVLVQAMRNGYWIILDELNLASTDILEALNRVLDDNRELFIPETQTLVKAHPNFMLFATQNPPGLYGGRKTLSRAFKNRFIELHFSEIPRNELEIILEKRCLVPATYAKRMVECMGELQKNRKTTTKNVFTLRDLFRWGNRYTYADKTLLEDHMYDWNQHLVEEGYLVLSAKVRTPIELEIIEETLYKTFRKRIDLKRLFDADAAEGEISPVTRNIITAIKAFTQRADIVWTLNMTRMAVLTAKALQFNEPVLLVGPTGCGKTTVCQILATIRDVQLRILNCHMHTEGADFLGGLRPCRDRPDDGDNAARKLFEWSDGPLIHAMMEGSYFMADEISLAEDSVLERLNCVLEPERTVLLAEKGGVAGGSDDITKNFVVQAKEGFQFLATMNPGGDFGKKELSPALRNRFTEIWCLPSDSKEDLIRIATNCMLATCKASPAPSKEETTKIATYLVEIVLHIRDVVDRFKFSIRDILAWANYITTNENLSFAARAIFGLETVFLDALEMLPHESLAKVESLKEGIIEFAIQQAALILGKRFSAADVDLERGVTVTATKETFGIKPFQLTKNPMAAESNDKADFRFNAPTTRKNVFRLLSALTLNKPILLEGPPGVGKTSIVESIAKAIGFKVVRINLCEHTDLADLFGTDLPIEDDGSATAHSRIGQFAWRDGPLLAALKAEHTWILLDELNLAPQSVLEGLNAILDHRGEVYIPELNKTFELSRQTRVFACQNPLRQGGGRKGLPQSFLNRFNKVYLRKLNTADMLHVVKGRYGPYFEKLRQTFIGMTSKWLISGDHIDLFHLYRYSAKHQVNVKQNENGPDEGEFEFAFNIVERIVQFSQVLERSLEAMEFGYKGGPYEFNLRDIMRWCDLLQHPQTGFKPIAVMDTKLLDLFKYNFEQLLLVLYERMKLVYYQRMRCDDDKRYIRLVFADVFDCDVERLQQISEDVCLYWSSDRIYLNDIVLPQSVTSPYTIRPYQGADTSPLLLASQRETLKNIVECVHLGKPVLICGNTDSGKTKLIEAVCTMSGQVCNTDTIDDSVTGSFQQVDLNRHLDAILERLEYANLRAIQLIALDKGLVQSVTTSMSNWIHIKPGTEANSVGTLDVEVNAFRQKMHHFHAVIQHLLDTIKGDKKFDAIRSILHKQKILMDSLNMRFVRLKTMNAGGSFEWVDSKIVKSLKCGQYILLEHVNICSSAVLDRLNPLFEPDGSLLISEKGVSEHDSAEVVRKSKNFRAFLTIDPKNGELSRAMRNRCVELSLNKATYSRDDLRAIVHSHGIHDLNVIKTIVRIHSQMEHTTAMGAYNMSHLTQMALLVASYKRIGYDMPQAIYTSAMEVYVYSTSTDLLGYGLAYFHSKLRDVVIDEVELYKNEAQLNPSPLWDPLRYFSVPCNSLNTLELIKLQAAPLTLLQSLTSCDTKSMALVLGGFEAIDFDSLDAEKLMSFYLYQLYLVSSVNDLNLRHSYIQSVIGTTSPSLTSLAKRMLDIIVKYKKRFPKECAHLPWNRKMMPRLRDYTYDPEALAISQKCSGHMLIYFLLKTIPAESVKSIQHISALSFSRGVGAGLITDKHKNECLKHLYSFIKHFLHNMPGSLADSCVGKESYVEILFICLWFNRLITVSETRLFNGNQMDLSLIDKIMVHFKWFQQRLSRDLSHCSLDWLNKSREMRASIHGMISYAMELEGLGNLYMKAYTDYFVQYPPIVEETQLQIGTLLRKLDQLLGGANCNDSNITQKLAAHKLDEVARLTALAKNHLVHQFDYKFAAKPLNAAHKPKTVTDAFVAMVQKFIDSADERVPSPTDFDYTEYAKYLTVIEQTVHAELEADDTVNPTNGSSVYPLQWLPLREYFFTKVLTRAILCPDNVPTTSFCEHIPWLGTQSWQLLQFMQMPKYKMFKTLWNALMAHMTDLVDEPERTDAFLHYVKEVYRQAVSFERVLMNAVHVQQLRNSQSHRNYKMMCNPLRSIGDCKDEPKLLNTMIALLFDNDGSVKSVPLKDLAVWQGALKEIEELMWGNAHIMTASYMEARTNLQLAEQSVRRFLNQYRSKVMPHQPDPLNIEQLEHLMVDLAKPLLQRPTFDTDTVRQMKFVGSMAYALLGVSELCLVMGTEPIDPVEMKRLKRDYVQEDVEYLTYMLSACKMLKITMQYNGLWGELTEQLEKHLAASQRKLQTFSQKIAVRPPTCQYRQLTQDIKHFVATQCDFAVLDGMLKNALCQWSQPATTKELRETQCSHVMGKLKNWMENTQGFLRSMLDKYPSYIDILQPFEYAVNQACYGMEGICAIMSSSLDLQHTKTQSSHTEMKNNLLNLLRFPAARYIKSPPSALFIANTQAIYELVREMPTGTQVFLRLLKAKMLEVGNVIAIRGVVQNDLFVELEAILKDCTAMWRIEEERRRLKQAEDDSLYVSKTKCENEDEELQELQDIAEYFPTNVEEDFGEFLQEATLEKVMRLDKKKQLKGKAPPLFKPDDYAFWARNFIAIMQRFTKSPYYNNKLWDKANDDLKIVEAFEARVQPAVNILGELGGKLSDELDSVCYNGFVTVLNLRRQLLNDPVDKNVYNFYKDPNITEVSSCMDVLTRIEERVTEQLELYPEHASLVDIKRVINRVRNLPCTAPVVRFSTGFQILRQKMTQWNEVAHRNNNLQAEELEVAEFVQKWTKLELHFWRNCLSQTEEKIETNAHKYCFFIHSLLTEYLANKQLHYSLTDIKYAEKRFVNEEILDDQDDATKGQVTDSKHAKDIVLILRQFVEAANYGDFHVRLQLLHAFELYLCNCQKVVNEKAASENVGKLIAGFRNIHVYYSQFAEEIAEARNSMRAPIEKKLREFVKIESYSKDLSYFSMRNNVARVHRNLSKFLKEYSQQLQQKITPVFQPQDATVKDYNVTNCKGKGMRYDSNIKYNLVDTKYFVASEKLRSLYAIDLEGAHCENTVLLPAVAKHFETARNIVKETLQHMQYPKLISAMDVLFSEQLERCEHLRSLQVDRSKERPHQVAEAKQILQQKRKGLTDLFKILKQLGVNYRKGLMEHSLGTEFDDSFVPAFCIKTMLSSLKDRHIHGKLVQLNESVDRYYAKCVFKVKLLENIMLAPLSELGPSNIERMKGLAMHFFLMVQEQRRHLSTCVNEVRLLLKYLEAVRELSAMANNEQDHFEFFKRSEEFVYQQQTLSHIRFVYEQFRVLLNGTPMEHHEHNQVLGETPMFLKNSPQHDKLVAVSHTVCQVAKETLAVLETTDRQCISEAKYNKIREAVALCVQLTSDLIAECITSDGEVHPIVSPLQDLLNDIDQTVRDFELNYMQFDLVDLQSSTINEEMENSLKCALMAFQKLYKKHTANAAKSEEGKDAGGDHLEQPDDIVENHLTKRIDGDLKSDWESLNLSYLIESILAPMDALMRSESGPLKEACVKKIIAMQPILEQYHLLCEYNLMHQLASHKVSVKMLSVLLTVFVEIGSKGFCVPADLMQDEEGQAKNEQKEGEGFGLEDGTGEKDASDKIESEDQLDDAKRPEDRKNEEDKEQDDCKEEKGIEMSDDFEGKMQDIEKPEEDDSAESEEDEEDLNKEMGETDQGAEKLDDQIWGDDEEPEQEEEEDKEMNEEDGKGSKDEKDSHNDLDAKNDAAKEQGAEDDKQEGLDATEEPSDEDDKKRKKQEKDIEDMKDPEMDDDQTNAMHNELEEPPEPEDMDLGDMNNLDEGQDAEDKTDGDNPFDIDSMKETMQVPEEDEAADEKPEESKDDENGADSDSSGEEESDDKLGSKNPEKPEEADENADDNLDEPETQKRGELDEEEKAENEENDESKEEQRDEKPEQFEPSKDHASKEDNVQSIPDTDDKASADQVQDEQTAHDVKQEQKMDEQETGEEKDGVGQADNDVDDKGHQGIADTKETVSNDERKQERHTEKKRKQGRTNEERSLGEAEQNKLKQLKTIDKMDTKNQQNDPQQDEDMETEDAEEYQHVKEPQASDKTTLDNATEEQAKKIRHDDEPKEEDTAEDAETNTELMEEDRPAEEQQGDDENLEEMAAEKFDQKSDKPSKARKEDHQLETEEKMEIDGEIVSTMTVPRSDDTTAHCNKEVLLESLNTGEEMSTASMLEMRKLVHDQLTSKKTNLSQPEDCENWQVISNRMAPNARELCEQLRLILEPTKCTRLKGDYRTGRRINMKKIIPYIASQFRKDKIWLRRTKPAQRDYKITIAIDDSKSMHHNNSKVLTLEAISLISQALTLLESGRLSVVSFGVSPQVILNHTEQFDGPKLVNALNFEQGKTKIAELLNFIRVANAEEGAGSSTNGLFENLLLVLSDGRNIFSEGKSKVRNAIKLARLQRIFLVYVIIDNPENKSSILDIQSVQSLPDRRVTIKSYLDDFPFPYYVIVRDLNQLPIVLSEAMRQWFELVNSEE